MYTVIQYIRVQYIYVIGRMCTALQVESRCLAKSFAKAKESRKQARKHKLWPLARNGMTQKGEPLIGNRYIVHTLILINICQYIYVYIYSGVWI